MIEYETSPALSAISTIRHGFFGRNGGVSRGDFAGLNISHSVGDDQQDVENNRQSVANRLNIGPLLLLRQVHSARVETVTAPFAPGAVIEADAMVTATPGLLLGVLAADCTPILFADSEAGVIGAAHAGWRGAVDGVVGTTIAAMVALGARPERIRAAYGPTIHGENYEVGDAFMADFLAIHPTGKQHFFTPDGGKPHFDLPGFVQAQLQAAGVFSIDQVGFCTYAHPDRYFSHRRATHEATRTGRQVAVIGLT
jgi:YfiH family protein